MTLLIIHQKEIDVPAATVWAQMRITCQISIGLYYNNRKASVFVFLIYLVLFYAL